jgi:hypothetical protein
MQQSTIVTAVHIMVQVHRSQLSDRNSSVLLRALTVAIVLSISNQVQSAHGNVDPANTKIGCIAEADKNCNELFLLTGVGRRFFKQI